MPAAGHLAAYNEKSAAYFTLVRLVFRTRLLAAAYYCSQLAYYSKKFDWAAYVISIE